LKIEGGKMRLINLLFAVLLVLVIFNGNLFSQFHVLPKIELKISFEDESLNLPKQIVLTRLNPVEKKSVYFVKIIRGQSKYTIYDIKPGKYIVSCSSKDPTKSIVVVQYDKKILFDPITSQFIGDISTTNEIEIKNNRNLKLEIVFKTSSSGARYEKEKEYEYRDFDFTRLVYYSENPDNAEANRMLEAEKSSTSNPRSICDGCGQSEVVIDRECTFDDNNIKVKLSKARFKNSGTTYVETGVEGVGTQDDQGRWVSGKCRILFASPLEDEITGHGECDSEKGKCTISLEYLVEIRMEVFIWFKDQMCDAIKGYKSRRKNKVYDLSNPIYCICFEKSAKKHEAHHCELWIDAVEEIKDILPRYVCENNYRAFDCCSVADEGNCLEQFEELKYEIFSIIADRMSRIYNDAEGLLQEPACYDIEEITFLNCVGGR
jgi:hypothetical protein